jgi:hypothetical protein
MIFKEEIDKSKSFKEATWIKIYLYCHNDVKEDKTYILKRIKYIVNIKATENS